MKELEVIPSIILLGVMKHVDADYPDSFCEGEGEVASCITGIFLSLPDWPCETAANISSDVMFITSKQIFVVCDKG